MATWKADIKTTNTGSIYSVTVEAGASYVAKEEIERLYRPIFIRNLRQVSRNSGSESSSESSVGGTMNYKDQLLLEINQIWQQLTDAGFSAAADGVDVATTSAGNDVTKLMAAHDYACWHLQELEKVSMIDHTIIE